MYLKKFVILEFIGTHGAVGGNVNGLDFFNFENVMMTQKCDGWNQNPRHKASGEGGLTLSFRDNLKVTKNLYLGNE